MRFACALKGGLLSIAPQELLLALQPSPLALTMACDLAYQRWLSSLEGQDLRTQSTKKNMEGRGRPARARPSHTTATGVRVWHDSRSRTQTTKDKFLLWIHQSLRHETLAHSLRCPTAAMFSSFPVLRQLLPR